MRYVVKKAIKLEKKLTLACQSYHTDTYILIFYMKNINKIQQLYIRNIIKYNILMLRDDRHFSYIYALRT